LIAIVATLYSGEIVKKPGKPGFFFRVC